MAYPRRNQDRRNLPEAQYYEPQAYIQRPARSSQERRLSEARSIFLNDETAKPILRSPYEETNPTSKALYYGTLQNKPFNTIATPDQAEFLAHQEELDRHERQLWGGGLKHRIAPISFWAGDWLRNNAFTYPRVQRHGRRLRLLERKTVLDRLTPSERSKLVEWWESKFGPIETPPTSPRVSKENFLTRTLAHVRGTKYWRARQAKRRAQEKESRRHREMTHTQRMDKQVYGGNPNVLGHLNKRSNSGSRLLNRS